MSGFPLRGENLENESGPGNVMQHEKLSKVMGFWEKLRNSHGKVILGAIDRNPEVYIYRVDRFVYKKGHPMSN